MKHIYIFVLVGFNVSCMLNENREKTTFKMDGITLGG